MHMREKGKRPLLLKHTPSGRESRASCQGTTFHFPDMRLRQEREEEGGCCGVRASAGPPGTPLPGGGKSMWFLSYLWEGWSTAANTDFQWAREEGRKERTPKMKTLWLLSLCSPHLFSRVELVSLTMCVWWCTNAGELTLKHTLTLHSTAGTSEVSEKVSNEENAVSPCSFTAVPSLPQTRPHMTKTNTSEKNMQAHTLHSRKKEGERERERQRDFHGNVICIISTSMVQVIRRKG